MLVETYFDFQYKWINHSKNATQAFSNVMLLTPRTMPWILLFYSLIQCVFSLITVLPYYIGLYYIALWVK